MSKCSRLIQNYYSFHYRVICNTSISFAPETSILNSCYLPWSAAALVCLLTTIVAPLTAKLSEVIQPSVIRFRWHVTIPNFLLDALTWSRTRARRDSSGGSQTATSTVIQASYVTLAITWRYARLTIAFAWCTIVSCITRCKLKAIAFLRHIWITNKKILKEKYFQHEFLRFQYFVVTKRNI